MINQYLIEISLLIVPVLLAVTFHEVAHGYTAYLCGDMTAKYAGRLTLNPIKHLDLMGSIVFLATRMIGWAKPVPINPMYFKNPKRDIMLVSLAGPATNFLLAIISAILLKIISNIPISSTFIFYKVMVPLSIMIKLSIQINVAFGFFNLIPIPPLDGSKVLVGLLPSNLGHKFLKIEPYGFIIILLLVFTNAFQYILWPVVNFVLRFLM
jgi:Zn-dependent protease